MKDGRDIKFVARTRSGPMFDVDSEVVHASYSRPLLPNKQVRVRPELFCHDDMGFYCHDRGGVQTLFMAGALTNAAIMYHYGDVISFVDDDFGDVCYDHDCFLDLGKPEHIKIWSREYPNKPKHITDTYVNFVRMAYEELGAKKAVQLGTYGKPTECMDMSIYSKGNPTWPFCTQGFLAKKTIDSFWFTPSILDTRSITKATLPYVRHEDTYLGLVNGCKAIVLPAFIEHIGKRVHLTSMNPVDFIVQKHIEQVRHGIVDPDLEPPRNDMQLWLEASFHRLCLECEQLSKPEKKKFVEAIFFCGERL